MASFTIIAAPDASGQRLDRFLAGAVGLLSRTRVKSLIEQGLVRRDGRVLTEPSEPVRAGATYELDLPPPAQATPLPQNIPFPILYEDADLIVLDKPAGLVVHPAPGNEDGTLVNALLAHCGTSLTGIGGERRPGIVHRLDKDTSGVMVVAKTQLANNALTAAFAARDLDRAYLALVWGLPAPLAGTIEGAIGRDRRDRKRMAVVGQSGKPALTHYGTCARGVPPLPCWSVGWQPGGHTRSAFTFRPPGTRWWEIRCICVACRPPPVACRTPFAVACWIFPARPCTQRGSVLPIQGLAPASASSPLPHRIWRNCWPHSTVICARRRADIGQVP